MKISQKFCHAKPYVLVLNSCLLASLLGVCLGDLFTNHAVKPLALAMGI
ncbi:hypothetical protein [Helicobacter bizzozeronii]|nr:hypothetical protein [Helicobacter bizzozeronii]